MKVVSMGPRFTRGLCRLLQRDRGCSAAARVSMGPRFTRGLCRGNDLNQNRENLMVSMGPRFTRGLCLLLCKSLIFRIDSPASRAPAVSPPSGERRAIPPPVPLGGFGFKIRMLACASGIPGGRGPRSPRGRLVLRCQRAVTGRLQGCRGRFNFPDARGSGGGPWGVRGRGRGWEPVAPPARSRGLSSRPLPGGR